jgi:hypothetical protein
MNHLIFHFIQSGVPGDAWTNVAKNLRSVTEFSAILSCVLGEVNVGGEARCWQAIATDRALPRTDGYFPMFCRLLASTLQIVEVAVFLRSGNSRKSSDGLEVPCPVGF